MATFDQQVAAGKIVRESGIVTLFPNEPHVFQNNSFSYVAAGADTTTYIQVDEEAIQSVMREYGIAVRGDAVLALLVCALHALGRLEA